MCIDAEPYDIDHATGEHLTAEDVIEQKDEEIARLEEEINRKTVRINRLKKTIEQSNTRTRQQAETLQALYLDKYDEYRAQKKVNDIQAQVQAAQSKAWLEGFYLATNRTGFQIVAKHNLDSI